MKTGKTLTQLAAEIERQRENRRDYVAPTRQLALVPTQTEVDGQSEWGPVVFGGLPAPYQAAAINNLAHRQIGDHAGIPAPYYDRMKLEAPDLLARNVNHWLHAEPSKRLVRVLDGNVRAFLSDRYRPLENADLAEAVLPVLMDRRLEVMSCEITERRLYIKAVDPSIQKDIPTGRRMGDGTHTIFDTLSPAIIISNSEVGAGSLSVETAVWTRACTNMAIFAQKSMRKYHLGGKLGDGAGIQELLSDRTKAKVDEALWAQVSDVVKGAFDQAKFDASCMEIAEMSGQKIEGAVEKVVEVTAKHLGIREQERPSVLKHLIEGGDLSRYGLFNAVTRTAEDLDDYDRATAFERMGGQIIDLSANDWRRINAQAA